MGGDSGQRHRLFLKHICACSGRPTLIVKALSSPAVEEPFLELPPPWNPIVLFFGSSINIPSNQGSGERSLGPGFKFIICYLDLRSPTCLFASVFSFSQDGDSTASFTGLFKTVDAVNAPDSEKVLSSGQ